MDYKNEQLENSQKLLHVFKNISSIHTDDKQNLWVINENNQLYKIGDINDEHLENIFDLYIESVTNDKDERLEFDNLVFQPENNSVTFNLRAPNFQSLMQPNINIRLKV